MARLIQIIPVEKAQLFKEMVETLREREESKRGSLKLLESNLNRRRAKCSHKKHGGQIELLGWDGEMLLASVKRKGRGEEWQLLGDLVGWIDRNFGEQIQAINIQFRD